MKKCTNSVDYTEIGIRIKQHRTKQGVTQQKLAELTGLSVAYLSQIERGNATASLHSLITIAKSVASFVGLVDIRLAAAVILSC